MSRPKHPKPDCNHRIVIDALEELGFVTVDDARLRYTLRANGQTLVALDISKLPGQIDWIVASDARWYLPIEVKQAGQENKLTAGELTWRDTIGLLVASNKDTVKDAVLERLGM